MTSPSEDFAAEIATLQTQFDILRYMRRVTQTYGFQFFVICTVPSFDAEKFSKISIISNLPVELVNRYDDLSLIRKSDGFRKLRSSTTPFHLTLEEWGKVPDEGIDEHAAVLETYLIQYAHYFPVHDADGSRAALILMGQSMELPMSSVMQLQMIAIHVYNRLTEIGAFWKDSDVTLSEREKECLSWTAAGKTSSEIAGILGLSEHTVNHYLNHVTKKLSAVNRTQAVVKAMRRGLIS